MPSLHLGAKRVTFASTMTARTPWSSRVLVKATRDWFITRASSTGCCRYSLDNLHLLPSISGFRLIGGVDSWRCPSISTHTHFLNWFFLANWQRSVGGIVLSCMQNAAALWKAAPVEPARSRHVAALLPAHCGRRSSDGDGHRWSRGHLVPLQRDPGARDEHRQRCAHLHRSRQVCCNATSPTKLRSSNENICVVAVYSLLHWIKTRLFERAKVMAFQITDLKWRRFPDCELWMRQLPS